MNNRIFVRAKIYKISTLTTEEGRVNLLYTREPVDHIILLKMHSE